MVIFMIFYSIVICQLRNICYEKKKLKAAVMIFMMILLQTKQS